MFSVLSLVSWWLGLVLVGANAPAAQGEVEKAAQENATAADDYRVVVVGIPANTAKPYTDIERLAKLIGVPHVSLSAVGVYRDDEGPLVIILKTPDDQAFWEKRGRQLSTKLKANLLDPTYPPTRIHINRLASPEIMLLYHTAKEVGKKIGYPIVYIHRGIKVVMVRTNKDKNRKGAKSIHNMDDLGKFEKEELKRLEEEQGDKDSSDKDKHSSDEDKDSSDSSDSDSDSYSDDDN